MTTINIIKDLLIFTCVYFPPLLILLSIMKAYGETFAYRASIGIAGGILTLIGIYVYQNFIPFVLVILCILYLKKLYYKENKYNLIDSCKSTFNYDYEKHGFSIKRFKILDGLKYAIISYALITIIATIFFTILKLFNIEFKSQEVIEWMEKMPLKRFLIAVPMPVIFAPVLEEFVFRWFLFEKVFKDRIGIYLAALLSSLLFAIIHFSLKAFLVTFLVGMLNCYLINKKGYWYAVFNHMLFNFLSTVAILLSKLKF